MNASKWNPQGKINRSAKVPSSCRGVKRQQIAEVLDGKRDGAGRQRRFGPPLGINKHSQSASLADCAPTAPACIFPIRPGARSRLLTFDAAVPLDKARYLTSRPDLRFNIDHDNTDL